MLSRFLMGFTLQIAKHDGRPVFLRQTMKFLGQERAGKRRHLGSAAQKAGQRGDGLRGDQRLVALHVEVAIGGEVPCGLRDALYEVTGRKLAVTFAVGEGDEIEEVEPEQSEEDFVSLFKDTFDAREVEED